MRLRLYQVDAFTGRVFRGNPAAVCPLERWLADSEMQAIAAENNLSETAFFVPEAGDYALRWFTPTTEVELCGHATLASAYVVFRHLEPARTVVTFRSRSGPLAVAREGEGLAMDFPALPPAPVEPPAPLVEGLGRAPEAVLAGMDYLAVFGSADAVASLTPDPAALSRLDRRGVIATAPGRDCDFVSRFFAPKAGIVEDPVTGSAHCLLVPYWSKRLGKSRLVAHQISARGGEIDCENRGARVKLVGRAVQYLEGTIAF